MAGLREAELAGTEQVLVPDIGDFEDVPVIEVLVAVGDTVAAEDPLVVLESDKATMEVPSPSAGKIAAIDVSVGDKVKEGTPIVQLEVSGGNGAAPAAEKAPPGTVAESVPAAVSEDVEAAAESEPPPGPPSAAEPASPQADTGAGPRPASPQAGTGEAPAYASPAVRRLARELGVDLSTIRGSGRKGRITKEDVQKPQPREQAPAAAAGDGAGLDLAPWPKVNFERFGEVERQPLTRIQKISGPNLARNWVMIPHVTHNDEADITELEAFRKRTNAEQSEAKVTMVALLAKAVVALAEGVPDRQRVARRRRPRAPALLQHRLRGRHAERARRPGDQGRRRQGHPRDRQGPDRAVRQGARGQARPAATCRARRSRSRRWAGSAARASRRSSTRPRSRSSASRARAMKPVWNGSEFEPRLMVPLSLSYDHRVIDGALAARFVAHLVDSSPTSGGWCSRCRSRSRTSATSPTSP